MGVVFVLGGSRYHTGIPKARLGWIVAMTGENGTLDGGIKNKTLMNCPMVGGNGNSPAVDMVGEEGKYCSGLRQESVVGVVGEEGVECSWTRGESRIGSEMFEILSIDRTHTTSCGAMGGALW